MGEGEPGEGGMQRMSQEQEEVPWGEKEVCVWGLGDGGVEGSREEKGKQEENQGQTEKEGNFLPTCVVVRPESCVTLHINTV